VKREFEQQVEVIALECEQRGLELLEVVREREPPNGKALTRPGFAYALERIAEGDASGLVVAALARITRSAAELGKVIEWLAQSNARLVSAAHALDTYEAEGQLAADLLVEISRWESARLSERTRAGLRAARRNGRIGRPAVGDNPDLRTRILQMRAQGMTLQAIADRFNEEGVPTVRGGVKWRHSSVQAAAGYVRRPRLVPVTPSSSQNGRLQPRGEQVLEAENKRLRRDLMTVRRILWDYWRAAHDERCTEDWPHKQGPCRNPPPPEVFYFWSSAASSPSLEASESSSHP
jgi:DNA invertase Pin-like site-specific DNA recombinase